MLQTANWHTFFNRNHIKNTPCAMKAIILGCFSSSDSSFRMTPCTQSYDAKVSGRLSETLKRINFDGKLRKVRQFYKFDDSYDLVVVTGLGDENASYSYVDNMDMKADNIRKGIFCAIKECEKVDALTIDVDHCQCPQSIGEIASLSNHQVDKWKTNFTTRIKLISVLDSDSAIRLQFQNGLYIGDAQKFAASLAEMPANLKNPRMIARLIADEMPETVKCIMRDKQWIESKAMNLFLSVNQGSVEPPVLLEAHYKAIDSPPILLVGKGITFDSGGISLKPSAAMAEMKADMQGAAVVFAAIQAIANLQLPLHVIGIAPFTENLPSGQATKPGDVFKAMNGKTVEVDNTDAEGRLVLADALAYAETFNPCEVIDLATLTGAVGVALGSAASAIYTRSSRMLELFKQASLISGDRVWHMPLFSNYLSLMESKVADLNNCSKKREAGSCTAAVFLGEFVKTQEWVHLDIAGVMTSDETLMPYCLGEMSGRPTRTLVEYLKLKATESFKK